MSEQVAQDVLQQQTQRFIDGPLKHIRTAALAAALLPLASIAAAPASAQTPCASAGVLCGTVFNDTNGNGMQDVSETGIEDVAVTICQLCNGSDNVTIQTDSSGTFNFFVSPDDTFSVSAQIPVGTQPSPVVSSPGVPANAGVSSGGGFSTVFNVQALGSSTDFGFKTIAVAQPGTGTPGYWKNHPNAWPVSTITVGGVTYTRDQAIAWLNSVGKDRTTAMFASLVPAMLNVIIGNDGTCINGTIAAGNNWMATYGPVGSNVGGGSAAWRIGEPIQNTLDAYNNGQLCAPHRQ